LLEVWPPALEAKTYEAFAAYAEPCMEIVESLALYEFLRDHFDDLK
jgi:hypothetical protein